jgi:hypothetical protein
MTSKSGRTDPCVHLNRAWTFAAAQTVLPYLASVMGSLRDHRLDALRHNLASQRLREQPGKPGRRDTLLALETVAREARLAEENYQETLAELQSLGIHCLSAVGGLALIPFYEYEQLVGYVFDLFDPQRLLFWSEPSQPKMTGQITIP